MPDRLSENAPAKINLCLHVTGKRDDGYHLLDSLAVFTRCGDRLSITVAKEDGFFLSGPFAKDLDNTKENLVLSALQAARGLHPNAIPPLAIELEKNIPVAAGLGGGSADAAACLRLLSKMDFLTQQECAHLAPQLGADVPACLSSRPCRLRGIGEQLSFDVSLPDVYLVLANPRRPLSTPAVFQARQGPFSAGLDLPDDINTPEKLITFMKGTHNDLTTAATALMPEISEILYTLSATSGCLVSRMSGSGATCFGLYAKQAQAKQAAYQLFSQHKNWWICDTGISSS